MDLKRVNTLFRAIQSQLALTPTVQLATKYLGLFTAYFAGLGGTILAMQKLKDPIREVSKTDSLIVFYGICLLPVAAVFFLHSLPSLVKHIRKQKRNAVVIRGRL